MHIFHRSVTFIALIAGLTACQPAPKPVQLKELAALPQDPNIQVYTNHNSANRFKDFYLGRDRFGDDLEAVILEAIDGATTSIDVAVQELRLPRIARALRDKQKAGIAIRIVIENTYGQAQGALSEAEVEKLPDRERDRTIEGRRLIDQNNDGQLSPTETSENDALIVIQEAGIKLINDTEDGSKGSNLMHHKFVVIDQRTVIMTSANFTISDMVGDFGAEASTGNANTLLKIQSPELASAFVEEFKILWGDGPGGLPNSQFGTKKPHRKAKTFTIGNHQVDLQFSPSTKSIPWESSTNGLISRTLQSARQSIDMALFVFSDQKLVNTLEPLHNKNVKIRALVDSGFIYRPYSEALDMLGITLTPDCKREADNRPWSQPAELIGTPKMPPGDLLHHKFGVIDANTVLVGSHNWTEAANYGNDEVLLVIHSPTVAAHYQREFDRLTQNAFFGIPPALAKKVAAQTCAPQASGMTSGGKINLNTATIEELDKLPGIGKKTAQRIIENRPMQSVADLDKIPGISKKTLKKLEAQVTW